MASPSGHHPAQNIALPLRLDGRLPRRSAVREIAAQVGLEKRLRDRGALSPYTPVGWLAAILAVSALLALVALSVPTRRALRTRPIEAIGIRE